MNAGLTVQEVLQMRSHIPFGESYKDPFGFQAKAYYRDGNRALLEPYRVTDTPGTSLITKAATPCCWRRCWTRCEMATSAWTSPTAFGSRWGPSTMRFGGWTATPPTVPWSALRPILRDHKGLRAVWPVAARFGRMEGSATVGQGFVTRMITPQNALTDEVDTDFYGYQIWLGTTDDGLPFSMMEGLRGQMVVSVPALDMVVVRTGYTKSQGQKAPPAGGLLRGDRDGAGACSRVLPRRLSHKIRRLQTEAHACKHWRWNGKAPIFLGQTLTHMLRQLHALVVDDEPHCRDLLCRQLERTCPSIVETATRGQRSGAPDSGLGAGRGVHGHPHAPSLWPGIAGAMSDSEILPRVHNGLRSLRGGCGAQAGLRLPAEAHQPGRFAGVHASNLMHFYHHRTPGKGAVSPAAGGSKSSRPASGTLFVIKTSCTSRPKAVTPRFTLPMAAASR